MERVVRIVCELMQVDEERVTEMSNLVDDLGADSLETIELVMDLDDEFDIYILDEDVETIHTVGDAVRIVQKYLERTDSKP